MSEMLTQRTSFSFNYFGAKVTQRMPKPKFSSCFSHPYTDKHPKHKTITTVCISRVHNCYALIIQTLIIFYSYLSVATIEVSEHNFLLHILLCIYRELKSRKNKCQLTVQILAKTWWLCQKLWKSQIWFPNNNSHIRFIFLMKIF